MSSHIRVFRLSILSLGTYIEERGRGGRGGRSNEVLWLDESWEHICRRLSWAFCGCQVSATDRVVPGEVNM